MLSRPFPAFTNLPPDLPPRFSFSAARVPVRCSNKRTVASRRSTAKDTGSSRNNAGKDCVDGTAGGWGEAALARILSFPALFWGFTSVRG